MAVEEEVIISFREGNSNFEKEIARIDKRLASIEGKFESVDESIDQASDSAKDLDKNIKSAEKSATQTAKGGKKLETAFKSAAKVFSVVFAADKIRQFTTVSLDAFKKYEKGISSLSAITGAVGKDLDFLKDKSLELSSETGIAADEIIEAYKLIGSAKPELLSNVDALNELTEAAITLSQASGEDLPTSARNLGSALNALNLPVSEAGRLINVLASASQKGAKEIPFINDALSKFGGVASSAGVEVEESVAAIELLGKAIPEASIVGNNLRNILIILQKEAAAQGREFVSLSDELGRYGDKANDITFLTKIFGREQLLAVQSLIKNKEELKLLQAEITDTNTAYEQAIINIDNATTSQEKLQASVLALQIRFGEAVSKGLRPFQEQLTEIAKSKEAEQGFVTLGKVIGFLLTRIAKSFADKFNEINGIINGFALIARDASNFFKRSMLTIENAIIGVRNTGIEAGNFLKFLFGAGNRKELIEYKKEVVKLNDELTNTSKLGETALDAWNDSLQGLQSRIDGLNRDQLNELRDELETSLNLATSLASQPLNVPFEKFDTRIIDNIKKQIELVDSAIDGLKSTTTTAEDTLREFADGSLLALQLQLETNEEKIKGFREDLSAIDPNDAAGIDAIKEKIQELTKENLDLEQSIIQLSNTLFNDFVDGSLAQLRSSLEITEGLISDTRDALDNVTPDDPKFDKLIQELKDFEEQAKKANLQIELLEGAIKRALTPLATDPLEPIVATGVELLDNQNKINVAFRKTNEEQKEGSLTAEQRQAQIEQNAQEAIGYINQIGTVSNQVSDISNSIFNKRLQQDEELYKKGLISEKELAKRKAEIAQKQAKAAKAQAIFEIGLSIAQGIANAIAASPLTGGLPFTAIVAALGAVQLAVASSAPIPPVPSFRHGVIDLQGPGTTTSDSIDAKLSRGESVMTAKETSQHRAALEAMRANQFDSRFLDLKNLKPADYKRIINMRHAIEPFSVLKDKHKPVNIINKSNNKDLIKNANKNFRTQNYLLKSVKGSIDQLNENINQQSASSYAI